MSASFSITSWLIAAVVILLFYLLLSIRRIGPSEIGLVLKRLSFRGLSRDNPVAFHGEAGYQAVQESVWELLRSARFRQQQRAERRRNRDALFHGQRRSRWPASRNQAERIAKALAG